jgi:hypothetical protein
VIHSKFGRLMSEMGQMAAHARVQAMSALSPKADVAQRGCDVRSVSKTEVTHWHSEER